MEQIRRAAKQANALEFIEKLPQGFDTITGERGVKLSGGQRQRVAICRALILHPEVLLFDEVTAALDPEMVREVLDVMLELADSGQTMLIVTHEMQFARAIADQVILLEDGGIVERSDDAERFFTNPTTERAKQFLHTFEFDRHRKSAEQSERSEQ